jgi:nitrate reductase NapAB chaperone NapD
VGDLRKLLVKGVQVSEKLNHSMSQIRDLQKIIQCILVCHNVTPVLDSADNSRQLQASSPDEVSLV